MARLIKEHKTLSVGKDSRLSRGEHSGSQTWLDTARCLSMGMATPAQARQSILLTRHHELPAPSLWVTAQGQHTGTHLRRMV